MTCVTHRHAWDWCDEWVTGFIRPRDQPGPASRPNGAQTEHVPALQSYSYAYGPIVVLLTLATLVLLLRWTFSRGGSVVERRSKRGSPSEYGVLEAVESPATYIEAEVLRRRLEDSNVKATVAMTSEGPRVMVFPEDLAIARAVLRSGSDQDPALG